MRPWRLRDRTRSMTDSARRRGRSHQGRTALPHVGARRLQHPPPGNRETLVGHPLRLAPAMEQQATDKPVPAFPPKRAKAPGIRRVRARGSLDVDAQIDIGAGTSALRRRDQALKAGCRHRASPCLRSSCSKALAIRSISAAPARRFRGVAPDRVTVATSLMIEQACASVSVRLSPGTVFRENIDDLGFRSAGRIDETLFTLGLIPQFQVLASGIGAESWTWRRRSAFAHRNKSAWLPVCVSTRASPSTCQTRSQSGSMWHSHERDHRPDSRWARQFGGRGWSASRRSTMAQSFSRSR